MKNQRTEAGGRRPEVGWWLAVISLISLLLCWSYPAHAGWFVPENRIAWQAWRNGDDTASLEHWDHSSKGMFGRATVLMRMGHLREAEQDFRQALADAGGLEPVYIASIWYNLGNCLYRERYLKQALEAWHQALQYNPGHVKAAHNLAVAGDLLKRRRERMNSMSRTAQKGKSGKRMYGGNRQNANGNSASGKARQARKSKHDGEHHGDGGNVNSMKQAGRELDRVRDSMDVFLRHRLAEKHMRTASSRRGPPW